MADLYNYFEYPSSLNFDDMRLAEGDRVMTARTLIEMTGLDPNPQPQTTIIGGLPRTRLVLKNGDVRAETARRAEETNAEIERVA